MKQGVSYPEPEPRQVVLAAAEIRQRSDKTVTLNRPDIPPSSVDSEQMLGATYAPSQTRPQGTGH